MEFPGVRSQTEFGNEIERGGTASGNEVGEPDRGELVELVELVPKLRLGTLFGETLFREPRRRGDLRHS